MHSFAPTSNSLFMRLIKLAFVLLIFFSGQGLNPAFAQGTGQVAGLPVKFSETESEFIGELGAMMRKTKQVEVEKSAIEFEELWNSGRMMPDQKQAFIALCNEMLKKRYRPTPHFEKVLDLFILASKRQMEPQAFFKLIETTGKVMANFQPTPAMAYVANLFLYFKFNMLYTNGFYKLKVSKPGKINFAWAGPDVSADTAAPKVNEQVSNKAFEDWDKETQPVGTTENENKPTQYVEVPVDMPEIKGPVITFEQVSLKFETGFDSAALRKTSGTYMIASGVFVGDGGLMDFLNAGLRRTEVYVELKKYSFRVRNPEFHADNVMLYNKNRLEATVLGAFEWKSKRKTSTDDAVYPRFKSYYNESRFKDIKDEGIFYQGGFSMEGKRVNSSSVFGGKSIIKFKNKNNWVVSLVSNRFDFNDTSITSNAAYSVVYYGNDSLSHPSCRMVYNTVRRELRLYKEKGKFKDCPFFDSGHNLQIMCDLLVWDLDKSHIDLHVINARMRVPALFESVDYFTGKRFSEIQGLYSYHPLMMLQGYAKKANSEEFNINDMATDFKQNINSLKSGMATVAGLGFIDYDEKNGNIRIKDKLFRYTDAQKNKKDFDQLSIPSLGPPRANARISVDTSDITIYGVQRFYLSDSLRVFIEPKDKKLIIKGNRNFEFNGKISAGKIAAFGDKFKFDYGEFKVDLTSIDSMEIESSKKGKDGKPLFDRMYGRDKNAKEGEDAIGHGFLYINEPNNKSAKKKLPQYPIFDIKSPSYIYFDGDEYLKGKYTSAVFFRIPPFEVDSANSGSSKSLTFSGIFHSDSIFPEFSEQLKVRPDRSLGFTHKTPPEGYNLYGTDARFIGTINMDTKGLRGNGEIRYLNATVYSEDFIFYQDSLIARGRKAVMEPAVLAGVEFPGCEIRAYAMKWNPKKKSMNFINAKGMPFQLYDKKISLEGLLSLSPSGLAGRGLMETIGAKAESERYKFLNESFTARRASFEVKSANPIKPAFACRNIKLDFSIKDQRADFSPEVKGYASNVLPFCQYKTSMPKATWWIEKKQITMNKPDSIDLRNSYFYSTKPEQDSLYFNATAAEYDIPTHNLVVKGIPYIHVADAEITPDSNTVSISEGGNMKTLNNATVVVDREYKYHTLKKANIKILSRKIFEGDGIYRYVNVLKDTLFIKFNEFSLVNPQTGKQDKGDVEDLYTVSGGEVPETQPVKLAEGILFKGNVLMSALKPNLEFEGQIKLDLKRNKNAGWVNYKTDGQSKEFVLNVANATDEDGQPLVSGLILEDGSNKLYTSFLGPKHNPEDKELFLASGILNFVEKTKDFRIGSQDRFDEKVYDGGLLTFNDFSSKITINGKLNLQGAPDKDFGMTGAGKGLCLLDSGFFQLNASLALDFNMPAPAWKNMGSTLAARVADMGLPEGIDDKTVLAFRLADMAGDKLGKEYEKQNQTRNVPVFQVVNKFNKSLFISDVTLNWSAKNRSWYSTGKIGISHVQNTQINGRMDGMLEIKYTSGAPLVTLYLEPSPDSWYYIAYDDMKRLGLSSAQDDFNVAIESKAKEGKEGTFFFTRAESYEKNRFIKAFKKNYLGIDAGEIVEEKPATREKEKTEETPEESEEPVQEKPKEKKKKKKEASEDEENPDEEKEKEKKPTPAEDDEFGSGKKSEEKPLKKEEENTGEEGEEGKPAKKEKKKKKQEKDETAEETEEPKKEEKKEEDGF